MIELRSPSDSLAVSQAKLLEYLENGTRLGWLIDPESEQVHVYRPGKEIERLDGVLSLSGEPELPGFVLGSRKIWEPGL